MEYLCRCGRENVIRGCNYCEFCREEKLDKEEREGIDEGSISGVPL